MRPPEFTGGNPTVLLLSLALIEGFNEAAGIHRRKRKIPLVRFTFCRTRFNEAAGIHRRKRAMKVTNT